ncbi:MULTISPECIES: ABC transporter family substrate-binding protein [unclassified Streptomyces]|uniref:ABC transporter family substrate-binding protein n=1 Tax=unclassified Streptomyces TaxID=2593676 RepID=UPI000DB988ED|nr:MULTISPECIES: ABC transporter family substrate-binding protein [unclassified Streptomyces]MYT76010.1 ABC transporter family substrate-binding protein [Streptomyces sp. SID8367]RAJ77843.1 peptide/nickel transport system substrate-binding protein [Streptomyces sp. PsTaAH-137]
MHQTPRRPGAALRSAAFLVSGALAVTALAGCAADDEAGKPSAGQDIAPAARDQIKDGGTLRWAVDNLPQTLNSFQADADASTGRVTGAVLPSMFRLDGQGRPQADPDYLEKAEVIETEPKQVVLYKLNQQAVWSDGREIGAPDFAAQWRALSGKDSAYWTAHNAGYDRIEKVERGANDLEVRVTFAKPYADWRALFSPLYPKDVMGTPDHFNDSARRKLTNTAGPFAIDTIDRDAKTVSLKRNPRWWGSPAKLDKLVLSAVPRAKRAAALAAGDLDLADLDSGGADRIAYAARDKGTAGPLAHGPGAALTPGKALRSWAIVHGEDEEAAEEEIAARAKTRKAVKKYAKEQRNLRGFDVRKSLEPAYTQLALNGTEGPLADERVRRAVARAIDRTKLAEAVLKPLGLPAGTVDNHLALAGQAAYADNSGALGDQDTAQARALLAEAGWVPGGPLEKKEKDKAEKEKTAGSENSEKSENSDSESEDADDGTYIVGEDDQKPGADALPLFGPGPFTAAQHTALLHQADAVKLRKADKEKGKHSKASKHAKHAKRHKNDHAAEGLGKDAKTYVKQGGAPGAYAPKGTAAPAGAAAGPLAKDGKPLTLRFVLPSGAGSEQLRTVADRITQMLEKIGVRTDIMKVDDESYFKDHIASGQYDLALYSWPASAYPATDARPIYAKPVPAADGSLTVEQNYTRVGTDQIDQLFDEAIGELDEGEARSLVKQADARIWAAAGSIPLYQRPELVAARTDVANAGAFGFQDPQYQNIGYLKPGGKSSPSPKSDD